MLLYNRLIAFISIKKQEMYILHRAMRIYAPCHQSYMIIIGLR